LDKSKSTIEFFNIDFQNVFLAIVNDTYHWVYLDLLEQKKEYQVEDYIKEASTLVADRVLSREKAIHIEEAVNMAAADGQITYEEIRQNLKKLYI
jgi:hypothetical protein